MIFPFLSPSLRPDPFSKSVRSLGLGSTTNARLKSDGHAPLPFPPSPPPFFLSGSTFSSTPGTTPAQASPPLPVSSPLSLLDSIVPATPSTCIDRDLRHGPAAVVGGENPQQSEPHESHSGCPPPINSPPHSVSFPLTPCPKGEEMVLRNPSTLARPSADHPRRIFFPRFYSLLPSTFVPLMLFIS